ncbi:hypothetical protein HYU13_05095 [Candidatus Woesearchaeota archaeon]|nr:hypothetical protein [Candidatus Woesearchaeota archaeon]
MAKKHLILNFVDSSKWVHTPQLVAEAKPSAANEGNFVLLRLGFFIFGEKNG